MKQRAWQGSGAIVLLFLGSQPVQAGIQVRDRICWVGTGDWQLREVGGEICLVPCRWNRNDRFPSDREFPWQISTPTIKDPNGHLLASDPAGRKPSVHLVDKKGTNTRWVFLIDLRLSPGRAKGEEPGMKAGPSGFTFRVKQAEGPFEGWYLAAGEADTRTDGDGKEITVRPVKLVKDVREATTFTYIETNYFVDHK